MIRVCRGFPETRERGAHAPLDRLGLVERVGVVERGRIGRCDEDGAVIAENPSHPRVYRPEDPDGLGVRFRTKQ